MRVVPLTDSPRAPPADQLFKLQLRERNDIRVIRNLMQRTGEPRAEVLRLDFDRRLMVQFPGSVVTSDAGLLAYRELDAAAGLVTLASWLHSANVTMPSDLAFDRNITLGSPRGWKTGPKQGCRLSQLHTSHP
jgi:hypothetical protein